MKKKKLKRSDFEETYFSPRKDWGNIKPTVRIIPNKKKTLIQKGFKEEY